MAVIGLTAGLIVRSHRSPAPVHKVNGAATVVTGPAATPTPLYTLDGYTRYSDAYSRFSIAYPSGWGTLQPVTDTGGLVPKNSLTTSPLVAGQPGTIIGEQGTLLVSPLLTGRVSTRYHDKLIQSEMTSTGITWYVLTIEHPTSATISVPLVKNANGVSYYNVSRIGEDGADCSDHEYVFIARQGLVDVTVPALCPLQSGELITKAAKAAYLFQLNNILNSVALTQ